MSDHLPECPGNWGVGQMPEGPCTFCEMLSACEERVLAEREADGPWFRSVVHQCCEDKQTAYAAALDAAEEAVRAALGADERNLHAELTALAAIDALREKL